MKTYDAKAVRILSVVCCSLISWATAPVFAASALVDEGSDALVLSVADGDTYTLTDEDVTVLSGSTKTLYKRGDGIAVSVDISSFKGDIRIEHGVFKGPVNGSLGAEGAGSVYVTSGATLNLESASDSNYIFKKKTVYLAGDGTDGKGALIAGNCQNSLNRTNSLFVLTADTTVFAKSQFNFQHFDLAGYRLRTSSSASYQKMVISKLENSSETPAKFEFTGGQFLLPNLALLCEGGPGELNFYNPNPAESNVWLRSYGAYTFVTGDWTCNIATNVRVFGAMSADRTYMGGYGFKCPVRFDATNYVGCAGINYKIGTNTVVNFLGPVSGSGHILAGPGWINLAGGENTYSGDITVSGYPGSAESGRAGIGLYNGTPLVGRTIFNDADLRICSGTPAELGDLVFRGGEGITNLVSGGLSLTGGNKVSSLLKEGEGTLILDSALDITGRLSVASGTVRLPPSSEGMMLGNAGLLGTLSENENPEIWSLANLQKHPAFTETSRWHQWFANGFNPVQCVNTSKVVFVASGYVWNRSNEDVTWTFYGNYRYMNFLWIDDELKIAAQCTLVDSITNDILRATVTLTPGAHKIKVAHADSKIGRGWQKLKGTQVYAGLAFDRQGRNSVNGADYEVFQDPGDGSLLTIDNSPVATMNIPIIHDAYFAPGAIFDLGGRDFSVEKLAGTPTITNAGRFTITSSWTYRAGESVNGVSAMSVDGELAFADGAIIDVEGNERELYECGKMMRPPAVVIRANRIIGNPVISSAAKAARYVMSINAERTEITLTQKSGLVVVIR